MPRRHSSDESTTRSHIRRRPRARGRIKLMLRYSARTQSHLKTRVSTPSPPGSEPVPSPRIRDPAAPRRGKRARSWVRSRTLAIICAAPYPRRGFIKTLITGVHACARKKLGIYDEVQQRPGPGSSPSSARTSPRRCYPSCSRM